MTEAKLTDKYSVTERNKVKRIRKRGYYDRETVYTILDAGVLCHLSYVIDGQPYCTPTAFWRQDDRLYWHGSVASRMLKQQSGGIAVCCTVSLLDGLVLARSGFHCSMNYRAVMAFGTAYKVDDPEYKHQALDAFIERLFPGRVAEMRLPTRKELNATTLMTMEIEQASAKIRTGPPVDDEEDYAAEIWAGVIPIQQTIGELQNCPRLDPAISPSNSIHAYQFEQMFDQILIKQS